MVFIKIKDAIKKKHKNILFIFSTLSKNNNPLQRKNLTTDFVDAIVFYD